MPPLGRQKNADIGNNRSPLDTRPGSVSSIGSGGASRSSGYSSNAQGESSMKPIHHASQNRSRLEPILPPGYRKPSNPKGNGTGVHPLSYRPNSSGLQSQTSSQPQSDSAPRDLLSLSPEPSPRRSESKAGNFNSHKHGVNSSNSSGKERSVRLQGARPGFHQKLSDTSFKSQGGSSAASERRPQDDAQPSAKPQFRGSANIAHPSHYQPQYRQSNLQFSSTPNTPVLHRSSSFQVVIPTTPANFYGNGYAVTDTRTRLSDSPSSSGRLGRLPKGLSPILTNTLPRKRGRTFSDKIRVEPTPKKRGRPFRTVESEMKAKAKADASASGTSTPATHKKKGRPFQIRHQLFILQPEPAFYPFKCEWSGCQAELHNLETLRLHIHVLHKKRVGGTVPCLWAKCGAKKLVKGKDGEMKAVDNHPEFASRREWKEHLEVKHLIPFSWHMGDGPKGTDLSGKPKGIINPQWLNDENGNEVTPSVKGQALEEGRARDLNKKRFRKMKGMDIYREKAEMKIDLKAISGGMGMLPPQISSDDEDEDTGADEFSPEAEVDVDCEALFGKRVERQVVRLGDDEVMDSDGDVDE